MDSALKSDPLEAEEATGDYVEPYRIADLGDSYDQSSAPGSDIGDTVRVAPNPYPKAFANRIRVLKNLQIEHAKLEEKFHKEKHALECQFATLYSPLYEKRNMITTGLVEPKMEECQYANDEEEAVDKVTDKLMQMGMINEEDQLGKDIQGLPDFWLTALKNVDIIAETIQEYDEPILKHLSDIKVKMSDAPMNFILEFCFEPNEFFTNSVLTKRYAMLCSVEANNPYSFEGPIIYTCEGCKIDWKEGQNVMIKNVPPNKEAHPEPNATEPPVLMMKTDSFFNFFDPPAVPTREERAEEENLIQLAEDFELGEFIRKNLVPRAVLYYTGEALREDDSDDEYDDSDLDSEDDEDDEDTCSESDDDEESDEKLEIGGNPIC